jgi:hypothetical protein
VKEVAFKVYRMGLQRLKYREADDQFFLSIKNRTYYSIHPISHKQADIYHDRMCGCRLGVWSHI